MWVLGAEPESSAKAASALNHSQVSSPAVYFVETEFHIVQVDLKFAMQSEDDLDFLTFCFYLLSSTFTPLNLDAPEQAQIKSQSPSTRESETRTRDAELMEPPSLLFCLDFSSHTVSFPIQNNILYMA